MNYWSLCVLFLLTSLCCSSATSADDLTGMRTARSKATATKQRYRDKNASADKKFAASVGMTVSAPSATLPLGDKALLSASAKQPFGTKIIETAKGAAQYFALGTHTKSTRDLTPSKDETAVSIPPLTTQQFALRLLIETVKAAVADLIVQTIAEEKSWAQVDWRRNNLFVVFGFSYLGGLQHWIMTTKCRQWFPKANEFANMDLAKKIKYPAGMLDAVKLVLFDILVNLQFLYFSAFYIFKELARRESSDAVDWVKDGVAEFLSARQENLLDIVQVWGFADCVQFFLPPRFRVIVRHLISFFWTAFVSFTRGSLKVVVVGPSEIPAISV